MCMNMEDEGSTYTIDVHIRMNYTNGNAEGSGG